MDKVSEVNYGKSKSFERDILTGRVRTCLPANSAAKWPVWYATVWPRWQDYV